MSDFVLLDEQQVEPSEVCRIAEQQNEKLFGIP